MARPSHAARWAGSAVSFSMMRSRSMAAAASSPRGARSAPARLRELQLVASLHGVKSREVRVRDSCSQDHYPTDGIVQESLKALELILASHDGCRPFWEGRPVRPGRAQRWEPPGVACDLELEQGLGLLETSQPVPAEIDDGSIDEGRRRR